MTKARPRPVKAQLAAMARHYPGFSAVEYPDGTIVWKGHLRPKMQTYAVGVGWRPSMPLPYVMILDPPIRPRRGGSYDEIPHLIYDARTPRYSGLCLFDPDTNEWTPSMLIAKTTMRWASEWLHYYELWHTFGEWLAPGVGYESVAQRLSAEQAKELRQAAAHVH